MMSERLRLFVVFLPVILSAGCSKLAVSEPTESKGHSETVTVSADPVQRADLERTISGIGTCTAPPSRQMPVTAAVGGAVVEILVQEGTEVQGGQSLIRLDDRLAQKELTEREAARDELKASLVLLKTLPREPELRQARLDVERAQLAVDSARTAVGRLEPLFRRREISEQQLYEKRQNLRDAQLALKTAEARQEVLTLGPKPEAVAEMQARIARADAAVETARTKLTYFELKAPRPGIVNRIACHPGQRLAAGTLAAEVVDPSEVIVTVWLPARDIGLIRKGQNARVSGVSSESGSSGRGSSETTSNFQLSTLDPQPNNRDRPLVGEVVFAGWQANSETGLLPVRVGVANRGGQLRLGMVIAVELVVDRVADALAVPEAALIPADAGTTLVVVRDGKAVVLKPTVGLRQNGLVEVIVEGLHAGDLVVTEGGYNLPDGTAVSVDRKKANGKTEQRREEVRLPENGAIPNGDFAEMSE